MKQTAIILFVIFIGGSVLAQKPKVHHTEPLFYDLVRDLGARKGEKEINLGAEFRSTEKGKEYVYLAEYEFAPVDRLAFEAEADFAINKEMAFEQSKTEKELEALRFSTQYSFFVSEKHKTTLAVGYTQILGKFGSKRAQELIFNPFFVAARRWGKNIHSMVYTYPLVKKNIEEKHIETEWAVNTSLHYTLPHSNNFIGVEFNEVINHGKLESTVRPQVKVKVSNDLALGMVTGFPIHNHHEGFSSFVRLIYEL